MQGRRGGSKRRKGQGSAGAKRGKNAGTYTYKIRYSAKASERWRKKGKKIKNERREIPFILPSEWGSSVGVVACQNRQIQHHGEVDIVEVPSLDATGH